MRFIVLHGPEGAETTPMFFTSEHEADAAVIKLEDSGEFCVVYKLSDPYYETADT